MPELTQGDIDHGIEAEDLARCSLTEFVDTVTNYPELRRNPVLLGMVDDLLWELDIKFYRFGKAPKQRDVSSQLRKWVFERDAYRCRECGDHHDLEIDHIFPISRGGSNAVENLQTLCKPCNLKKGTEYHGWDLPDV